MSCTHSLAIARGQDTCHLCGKEIFPGEVIPKLVTKRAEILERGGAIIGGRQWGKTLAARIAAAKPVNNQPSPIP